jgi:superoxide dismutase, Fe-Mn family
MEAFLGSVDACKKELAAAAVVQFGSGWIWLFPDGDKLKVMKTTNAENPLKAGQKPLLTVDVNAVLDKLINWDFARHNLG